MRQSTTMQQRQLWLIRSEEALPIRLKVECSMAAEDLGPRGLCSCSFQCCFWLTFLGEQCADPNCLIQVGRPQSQSTCFKKLSTVLVDIKSSVKVFT